MSPRIIVQQLRQESPLVEPPSFLRAHWRVLAFAALVVLGLVVYAVARADEPCGCPWQRVGRVAPLDPSALCADPDGCEEPDEPEPAL